MESFFDLRIATISEDEPPPADAHLVRIRNPRHRREGWYYKPCYVTYVLKVPGSIEEYIETSFPSHARKGPRKVLREVPKRYTLVVEPARHRFKEFEALYEHTVVARPRGKDRLAEHDEGFERGWLGFYLLDRDTMVAGVLVHRMTQHLSVAYGAFDPEHRRKLDLEHFLLMQVLQRCIDEGARLMSLGMDTNRYGHHLSLHLPVYKLRLGFSPVAYEPAGRELMKVQSLDPFEHGLFFYAYGESDLVGQFVCRAQPDLRPFQHRTTPPLRVDLME